MSEKDVNEQIEKSEKDYKEQKGRKEHEVYEQSFRTEQAFRTHTLQAAYEFADICRKRIGWRNWGWQ